MTDYNRVSHRTDRRCKIHQYRGGEHSKENLFHYGIVRIKIFVLHLLMLPP